MTRCGGMRRRFGRLIACLAAATAIAAVGAAAKTGDTAAPAPAAPPAPAASGPLAGWLLVAAPHMPDPRFAGTVIFMLRHGERGAVGLIVNRLIAVEPASKVLERILGKDQPDGRSRTVRIQYGGPVDPSQGFFMHSSDYADAGTVAVTDKVSLTGNQAVLLALAEGKGPARGFLAIGYAGWGPGQLENELRRKDWITVFPDAGLLFDDDMQTKWRRAMDKRGADL